MAETVVSDGIPGIQDEGLPNISDGNEDWGSAGIRMMLAQAVDSSSYVRSDSELTFTNHDGTNDQVDVTAGVAYLDLTGETVNYQSSFGGSSPPSYDTALPVLPAIPVICPTTTANLDVQDSTLSSVWLAYATDGTVTGVSAGDVYFRSDDTGSVTAPSHPSVKLGESNPDNASADVLNNRFPSPDFNAVNITKVGTQAHNTSDQTISTGTTTTVVLGATTDDNLGAADLANNQIVIQDAGDYILFGQTFYQGDSGWTTGDTAGARVHLNGTLVGGGGQQKLGTGGQRNFANPTYRTLSANDTVDLRAFQSSGSDQTLGSGDNFCALSVVKVG